MHTLQSALWPTHWGDGTHVVLLAGVGMAVAVVTRLLGNPGDVELLVDNIHVMGGRDDVRDLRSLIPVSLLCISVGGAMGPEAPLVQTGGSFGSWVAHRWHLDRDEMRILTITGMAAAFTVLFGAPLGSAIFALEILHRRGLEYYEALLPAIIGSLAGFAVYVLLTGVGFEPVWDFARPKPLHVADLAWALACGVIGALLAAAFTYVSTVTRWVFRHLPPDARPLAGGVALGLLALWSPYAITFGEAQIDPLMARRALVATFLTAGAAKMIGTSVTLSSGWRGGFIIPLFFIGVSAGRLLHLLVPATNEIVVVAALMAATNVGVTKTPLGSTVVVSEMAGLRLLPTTLIASVVSLFLTSGVGLIHTQRDREGAFARTRDEAAVGPVAAATGDPSAVGAPDAEVDHGGSGQGDDAVGTPADHHDAGPPAEGAA